MTQNLQHNLKVIEKQSPKPGLWFSFELFDESNLVATFETQIDSGYNLDSKDGSFEKVYTIYRLVVHTEFKRRGYGSFILNHCENLAVKHELKKLVCLIHPIGNEDEKQLVAFYKHNGFRIILDEGNTYAIKNLLF